MIEKRMSTEMLYVQTMKPHFSAEELEIILVMKGNITIQKAERTVIVKEGEFTLINRYIVHSIQSEGAYILTTKIRLAEFKHVFDKIEYVEFLNNDEFMAVNRPLKTRLNGMLIDLLINQYCSEHHLYESTQIEEIQFNENRLIQMLFCYYQLISHMKQEEEYPTEKLQSRYYAVVEYVMQHTDQKIVVEDILNHLYMNPTYFSQFMKKIGGVGFKDFMQYRKLIIIQGYLLDNHLSMAEIANHVGIYDMKSFYNIFKRFFKKSPKRWKEEISQLEDDYTIIFERDIFETFISKYHINSYEETTSSKLYRQLLQIRQHQTIELEDIEILMDPYADMEEKLNPHYQAYKYFNDLLQEIHRAKAILHLMYRYQYLKDIEQEQLLINAIRMASLIMGTGKMKKLKLSLIAESEIELLEAKELKKQIEQKIGNMNINIVMNLSL